MKKEKGECLALGHKSFFREYDKSEVKFPTVAMCQACSLNMLNSIFGEEIVKKVYGDKIK